MVGGLEVAVGRQMLEGDTTLDDYHVPLAEGGVEILNLLLLAGQLFLGRVKRHTAVLQPDTADVREILVVDSLILAHDGIRLENHIPTVAPLPLACNRLTGLLLLLVAHGEPPVRVKNCNLCPHHILKFGCVNPQT
jgi:hypothetical protein